MAIAEGQWREVALSDEEYARILELLGREPSEVELGMFGAMWSEHCGYKHSRPLLKKLPTEAPWVLQGPGENAGAVDLGNGYAAVFKAESHNHPSAVEPYEGAATGIGGCARDIFTMGARPVATLNALRIGPLDAPRNGYLLDRISAGLAGYGNTLGVPAVGGEIFFDASYNGNPLVNAMVVGVVADDGIVRAVASGVGNVIMVVGAPTGRDGLGGATFSSVDDPEATHSGFIQAGNPFLERQLMEACLELLNAGAIVAMQDLGAAGMTSSVVECASRGDVGAEIDMTLVPKRDADLTTYEIMLSETQERMVLVAEPERVPEITAVLERWELDAAVIGRVTDTGRVVVRAGDEIECDVPAHFFTEECPTYSLDPEIPAYLAEVQNLDLNQFADIPEADVPMVLTRLLASPNLGTRASIYQQFDSTAMANTVVGPEQGDAAVLRLSEAAGGMAISIDCNSRYVYLDPYIGAQHAVAEAARNVASTGARPLGLTNCLNFGSPDRNPADYQLVHAVRGMGDAARSLDTPIVSGNVSLNNETDRVPIYPTPTIGCVGVFEDIEAHMNMLWRQDQELWLIGAGTPSMGGSEYLAHEHGLVAGTPPSLNLEDEAALIHALRNIASAKIGAAAHDLSAGGLAVAIAEMALATGLGVHLEGISTVDRVDVTWFGESASRALVAIAPQHSQLLQEILTAAKVPGIRIGIVGGKNIVFPDGSVANISELVDASSSALALGLEAVIA